MNLTYTAHQYKDGVITIKLTTSQFTETIAYKQDYGQRLIPFINVKSESTGKIVTFVKPGESLNAYWYENTELKLKLKLLK